MTTMLRLRSTRGAYLTFCVVSMLISAPAASQDDQVAAADEDDFIELEEVIVTGTRIKRRDFVSPSPLVTVSKQDIEFSGQPLLEEYFNQLPQMQPVTGRALNNGSDGSNALNLRGLGADRTLVLLNGRRVAPSGTGSAIDLNNIPSTLIDRVEIITGGASTVYGSDAIAGVVNFITRNDFSGLSVEGGYNITEEGDANIWDTNLVYGLDLSNGGNIAFYAGHYDREELFASERDFASVTWADDWESGYLQLTGSGTVPGGRIFGPPGDLGSGPVPVTWDPDGTPRQYIGSQDYYNFAPVNYMQTPQSRDTLGAFGTVPFSAEWEGYFEVSYAKNDHASNLAPAPYQASAVINTDNPILTPETQALFSQEQFIVEPGLAGMFLGKRLLELGPRLIEHNKEYQRVVAGVRGLFGDGWELDAWVTYTDADEEEVYFNTGSIGRIQQGLLVDPATGQCFDPSGGCVPVDLFGEGRISPEALAFIRVDNAANTSTRTQWLASAVVTGAPFDTWSGPVDMAFGVEWRSDEAHFVADEIFFTGDAIGLRGDAPIDGTESVYELYAEAIAPLYESESGQKLELELGFRWSDYDNAGSVETWKAGINWQLNDSVRFRSMLQHAVRAPNNRELFQAQFSEFGSFVGNFDVDPCSASQDPVGNGNAEKCILQGLSESQLGVFEAQLFYPTEFVLGGNPGLVPEASDTFTIGMVVTPVSLSGLTFTIDYYDLEVEDTIGPVDSTLVCFDPLNAGGVFCENLQRDGSGNVFKLTELIQNRGVLATDGIDFQVNYVTDLPAKLSLFGDFASLSLSTVWTHVLSLKSQENIVTEVRECAGLFGWPCANFGTVGTFPENRMLTNINYGSGPFDAHLTWSWIDGMDNAAPLGACTVFGYCPPVLAVPSISSWNYLDLGLAWQWDNGLLVRFGINNLTDKDPPLLADQGGELNTDHIMYDVYGRSYYINLRYEFGF